MAGDIDDLTHLGPLLASEGVDRRITVNLMAAKAFLAEGRPDQALICAERLFRLSGWQPAVAPVLLSILDGMGAVARATEVRKIACLSACKAGDFALVRRLYLDWRYHHVAVLGREVFDADPCVIEGLDRLAERLRPPGETPGGGRAPRQTPRVLYVLSSVTQEGSVLAKLMAGLLTHHDASRCEVGVAIADADQRAFEESAEGRQVRTVATLRGWTTFVASEAGIEARLRALRARVIDWAPDLLVTNAALAQPEAYLLVRSLDIPWVAQVVGPPAQFTAPGAVFNIASDERLLMDCPGSGTIVRVEVDLPDDQKVTPLARTALGIPEGAPVLCGAGRPVKFSPRYLAVVAEVLRKVPTSWFLALGVGREGLAALPEDVAGRVVALPWTRDYLGALALGDLMIDTFPSGGGVTVMDAMALSIPVLVMGHDLWREYRSDQWSVAHEFALPDLVIAADDDGALAARAVEILGDALTLGVMGARARPRVVARRGDVARMTKRFEDAYRGVLDLLSPRV